MKIRQSQIVGAILTLGAVGTLINSAFFCKYANNHQIGVDLFETAFENLLAERDKQDFYYENYGFQFLTPVPLPGSTSAHQSSQSTLPPMEIENEGQFAYYLRSIKSNLLVAHGWGELKVKCYIPRFWHASMFAITASICQMITAVWYILMEWKSIKSMSAFFYSYFFVFITHLACGCIVLNGIPNRKYDQVSKHNYSRSTSDIFVATLFVNCCLLVSFVILTACTCNTEEYSDRCVDKDTCNRTRSLSTANILSASASADRLN